MKRVVIGMSGGVDSSVAAILLKEQGYEVVGVTFKFIDDFDESDAVNVCEKLGIKHHIIDARDEFKDIVINSFIKDYKNGITPNPCVLCNKEVKFNFLYKKMLEFNCDYIATGHYAKIIDGKLYRSSDLNKDQTYFLAGLTNEQLNRLLLPLEGITKEEVRNIAKEYELLNYDKKDSFDVCFIKGSFKDYISDMVKDLPGNVIDIKTGKLIGKHNGLSKYTIGQRKGLDIGGNKDKMFVVGKDLENNILYIAFGKDNEYLLSDRCIVKNVNFNSELRPNKCSCKFRYRQADIDVELEYLDDNKVYVKYDKVKSVTPGQACVFYIDDLCIGGGTIDKIYKDNEELWYL